MGITETSKDLSVSHIPDDLALRLGDSGTPLHFAHANGFPPGAYLPLLEHLAQNYRVSALPLRPLWSRENPETLADWRPLADDLQRFLEKQADLPWVGVGHSLGGNLSLRLAIEHPGLFQALVLIEPVLFAPWFTPLWRLMLRLGLAHRVHPLVRGAIRRRNQFASSQAMFASYRRKKVFSRLDDQKLWAYVNAAGKNGAGGGYQLAYPAEWEARIYLTASLADPDIWRRLEKLTVPVLVICATEQSSFSKPVKKLFARRLPAAKIHTVHGAGHLLPMEQPALTARLIHSFLSEELTRQTDA
jgi:pimeloyl-ACP methyl ester carboxylesterase